MVDPGFAFELQKIIPQQHPDERLGSLHLGEKDVRAVIEDEPVLLHRTADPSRPFPGFEDPEVTGSQAVAGGQTGQSTSEDNHLMARVEHA